jgi:hypothetical protein
MASRKSGPRIRDNLNAPWPAHMKSHDARRPSDGGIHGLVGDHTVTMFVTTSMLPRTDFEYGQI